MKSGLLIMAAVAVLLPSSAEGRIVSRCEVRDDLKKMLGKVDNNTLATVICEVERRSHLNTSLVTMLAKPMPATSKPMPATSKPMPATSKPMPATSKRPGITTSSRKLVSKMTNEAVTAKPTHTNSATSKMTNAMATITTGHVNTIAHKGEASTVGKPSFDSLYGLFQLSGSEFCDSGLYLSKNECKTSCTSFTNDDITDDTACVIKTGYWKVIEKEASALCRQPVNFFNGCK